MAFSELLYLLMIGFIRTVKWIELQFLKLFSPWLIRKSLEKCESLGIICHFEDDTFQNWNSKDEKMALEKCTNIKYDTLVHIRVYDKMVFVDAANTNGFGIGQGYVHGKWDFCKDHTDIAEVIRRMLENNVQELHFNWWNRLWTYMEYELFNRQTRSKAMEVIEKHYDLGNDIYEATLDPWMQYTCGYWANADNLNEAQEAKLELIAQKLNLKPGMRVLDIGCGWGMLCKYLAEKHGVECVGVTISQEGADYSRKACEGLPVEIRIQDYRDIEDSFDRVVVVGMIEHVGFKNYGEFIKIVHRNLKEDGIFLLQTIGVNHGNFTRWDRWIGTHIFPNGCTPKPQELIKAAEGSFIMEDWHNFSLDYSKTLSGWRENFLKNWPTLKGNYGEEFYRIWNYYLSMCEGVFLARRAQLWQIVFSKDGLKEGYIAPR